MTFQLWPKVLHHRDWLDLLSLVRKVESEKWGHKMYQPASYLPINKTVYNWSYVSWKTSGSLIFKHTITNAIKPARRVCGTHVRKLINRPVGFKGVKYKNASFNKMISHNGFLFHVSTHLQLIAFFITISITSCFSSICDIYTFTLNPENCHFR